ncbi:hypothetical protein P3G55_08095 [Leptospira sp. 96542]|nr:hypothetical protein [Leptospira sp. 96542]
MTTRTEKPRTIPIDSGGKKEKPITKEEEPEVSEEVKEEKKPRIIMMMRDDLFRASDFIESILKPKQQRSEGPIIGETNEETENSQKAVP